jgi:hypothetical protein
VMTKALAPSAESPTAAYDEWDTDNDRRAYDKL